MKYEYSNSIKLIPKKYSRKSD